jgi:O-succinylbenzoic acid--CoA ligase
MQQKKVIFLTESEQRQKEVFSFIDEWLSPIPHIMVETSGSTGDAKKISLQKKHLRKSAKKTCTTFSVPFGGSAFLCLSMHTIAGKMMIVRAFENNMTLYVGDVRSDALCKVSKTVFDLVAMVPLQLEKTMICNPLLLKDSGTVLVGGSILSSVHFDGLKKIGATVIQTYGMTETLSHIAYRNIGLHHEMHYTTLEGVYIHSENDCLVITCPELDINELHTNDLVKMVAHNQFTYIGRADFILNSGGIKFNPEELESMIQPIMEKPFFIGSLPDKHLGERIILLIEGTNSDEDKTLLERIHAILPKYGCPKEICYLPSFVRSSSLKIQRKATLNLVEQQI